jgi:hypothetical protein
MALSEVGARTVGLLDSGDMDVPAPDRRLAAGIATTAVAICWRTSGLVASVLGFLFTPPLFPGPARAEDPRGAAGHAGP